MKPNTRPPDSPATLVAILVAAHKIGDRDLERRMRERLETDHRVKLTFLREPRESEAAHAD